MRVRLLKPGHGWLSGTDRVVHRRAVGLHLCLGHGWAGSPVGACCASKPLPQLIPAPPHSLAAEEVGGSTRSCRGLRPWRPCRILSDQALTGNNATLSRSSRRQTTADWRLRRLIS